MTQAKDKSRLRFLILIIAIVLIWYLGKFFRIDTQAVEDYLKRFPLVLGAVIFIGLYVVVTFFIWLSKDIFKIASAIIFGPGLSTLFIWIAEIINAFILFHLARFLGRGFVEKTLGRGSGNLDDKLAKANLFWLFLMRGAPLIPFRFLDLACGLTRISFKRYLIAVIFASPVRIFWLQYILAGVGRVVLSQPQALMDYLTQNRGVYIFSFVYFILAIIVAAKIKIKG